MALHDYFQAYRNYFWQWEEKGEVLAIPQSSTIAYKNLIAETLERISSQGIPPFGSILLVIIATNPDGKNAINTIYSILCNTLKTTDDACLANAIEFLKLLSEVPVELKKGKKRILLLQAVFENCHNIFSVKRSKEICQNFFAYAADKEQIGQEREFDYEVFYKDFKPLAVLKDRLKNIDEILSKVMALPDYGNTLLELEPATESIAVKDFTEQLIENPKTFHVGSLMKHIWGGLNIPLHSALPSQQPLGGVADLTNKGDFDKLLISEFANDDLIFMSRLANNEALFIHREIPPANNSLERIILMDVSLKNWGTPKTVSFATMLAIARHPKTDIACSVFAVGTSVHPVSIENAETIIEGLQHLEGGLHAGSGIDTFFKMHPSGKNREIFFITEPSTLKHPAMSKVMSDYQPFINYWIFTDNSGNIDIYKKQQSSKKHIQHIQLPLEKLWKKEPGIKQVEEDTEDNGGGYPILFGASQNVKILMTAPDGQIFIITGDKVLFRRYDPNVKHFNRGWEYLMGKIPVTASEFEIGLSLKGEYLLLMFSPQTRELILMNLASKEKKIFSFPDWRSVHGTGFIFQDQKFYHINNSGLWAIDFNGIAAISETHPDVPGKPVFEQRAEALKKARATFRSNQTLFRNIKTVFINEENHLVLNIHELFVNKGDHLKLEKTTKLKKMLTAEKIAEKKFIFHDGSTVEINKTGLILLKSSSDKLPLIYLPSCLDASLAVATESCFAGPEFYYPEPQFDVVLTHNSSRRVHLIKTITNMTGLGLKQVHDMLENTPCTILRHQFKTEAVNNVKILESWGASANIQPTRGLLQPIEKISIPFFYSQYIGAFTRHILGNGIKH